VLAREISHGSLWAGALPFRPVGAVGATTELTPSRGTEGSNPSPSGSQSVSLVPSAATGTKGPAFAANVSLDETRERDMLASNRLAFAFFL
jgi:hypothetical protein